MSVALNGRPPAGATLVDLSGAERAAADLLTALGADLDSEHLRETPRRVAQAYAELLTPAPFNATTFPNDEGYDELVLVRDIPFQSLCAHHLLPFHGTAHVAYLPGERIIGLSKLAPRGVGVIVEAEHLCMSLRGVQKPGALTVTSALRGIVRDDPRTREEFLSLVSGSR